MSVMTETLHAGGFIVSEGENYYSRAAITIGAEQELVAGTVLGKIGEDTGTVTVGTVTFAGAGNGTCTKASPAYGDDVQEGTYTVVCVESVADGGVFQVVRPDGTIAGTAKDGVAYDGEVKFTLAHGATDWDAGDAYSIPVSIANDAAAGIYVAFNQDGADGENIPVGVLFDAVTTGEGETASAVAIVRHAQVRGPDLTWPADIEAGEKASAIAALAAIGIIVR